MINERIVLDEPVILNEIGIDEIEEIVAPGFLLCD